mmetsp:Transcript_13539/g.26884  ORF Transcript_13539/g.26884 Transcript_13539/m.26884 type:complete len:350 (+) Transcript_13539:70-1119(+)
MTGELGTYDVTTTLLALVTTVFCLLLLRPSAGKKAMIRTPSQAKELLTQFLRMSEGIKPIGFGAVLSVGRDLVPSEVNTPKVKPHVSVNYRVPQALCLPSSSAPSSPPGLPLGVLLAIFDDVSTWPIIVADPLRRPGVSVHLSATYLDAPVAPDSELLITSDVKKLGNLMAFCSLECRLKETGELVAVGEHTKYLPMGWVYEKLIPNFLGPLTLFSSKYGPELVKNSSALEAASTVSDLVQPLEPESEGNVTRASFSVTDECKNPMGGFHGGCQALVAQVVAGAGVAGMMGKGGKVLKSVSVSYMSTGKGVCDVVSEVLPQKQDDDITTSVEIMREDGRLISTAMMTWK